MGRAGPLGSLDRSDWVTGPQQGFEAGGVQGERQFSFQIEVGRTGPVQMMAGRL